MALSPRALVHNWRLKLSALGLAVVLWALVQTEPRNADTFSSVPVVVDVLDTAWTASAQPEPSTVQLRVSGPAREIYRLAREGTAVRVPIRHVGSRDTLVTLDRGWVALGPGGGLSVESISPSAVRVSLEPSIPRALPVAIETKGELPDHLAFASPIGLNPPVIRVRGPASRVSVLDSVRLVPLDLSRIESSGVIELPVDTSAARGLRFIPPRAMVGIRVEEVIERVLAVPVIARSAEGEGSILVRPDSVVVTLRGARTIVSSIDAADLRAWVTPELVQGMAPGEERRVPVRVEGIPRLVGLEIPQEIVTVRRPSEDLQAGDGT